MLYLTIDFLTHGARIKHPAAIGGEWTPRNLDRQGCWDKALPVLEHLWIPAIVVILAFNFIGDGTRNGGDPDK